MVPEEVEKRVLLILIWPDSALSRRVAEAESILTEPVVWAWCVPRKSETRKRAARSGEGTRKALWRRPFRAERRFWTSSRVSSWMPDRDSMTSWPRARSSSRFPTIWERLPWSPQRDSFLFGLPEAPARLLSLYVI